MAHSDILIFLTNISWIFFLFLFCYSFFVLFFLPTFYKKVRARTLIKLKYQGIVLTLITNSLIGVKLYLAEMEINTWSILLKLVNSLILFSSKLTGFSVSPIRPLVPEIRHNSTSLYWVACEGFYIGEDYSPHYKEHSRFVGCAKVTKRLANWPLY